MEGKFIITKQGLPLGHDKIESIDDARQLANNMADSGHYPAGLSPCFTAGINGDWEEDGICPIYKIDKIECTCDEEFKSEWIASPLLYKIQTLITIRKLL